MELAPASPSQAELSLKPSWKSYFVFYAAILIFGVGPLVNPEAPLSREAGLFIGAGLAAFILLIRRYSSYTYGGRIFSRKFGWGSLIQVKTLPLDEVASVVVRRGVVHRLVGIGHLHFQPGSTNLPDLWWFGVDQPFEVKKKVEQILRRERLVRK
ncbi:MAG: hypothetical protein EHM75_03430 [Desulfobacteraceae bacterium]|nr:MAG: hypothetical protein EHM75_03430 [Desulfobacteraceae bacterium]